MPSKPFTTPIVLVALALLTQGCATVLSATRDDDRGTLARLLRSGASPDEGSTDGVTPMFEAIEQNNLEVVRMLVEAGADVNRESLCRGRKLSPLQKAAVHGSVPIVRYLLEKGADPAAIHADDHALTLLALSPDEKDSGRIAELILAKIEKEQGHGALVAFLDKQSPSGWTALAAAAYAGDAAIVHALLARGAAVSAMAKASNADSSSSDEWPPLHFAAVREHDGVVARLVRAGADPDQRSKDGQTSSEVVAALEQRRAEERARRREEEREERERSRATFEAFQRSLASGSAQASSSNPVDDDTFQKKMEAIARQSRSRPAAPEAAGSEPASPTTSATGTASGPAATGTSGAATGASALAEKRARDEEAKKQEQARKQQEERDRIAKEKADREARAVAEKAAAEQAREQYLSAMRQGIQLRATKCPDGEGHYYATGRMPRIKGDYCIDVHFRATCASSHTYSGGVARNFVGHDGCFGDTYQIDPKPPCPVEQVSVRVTDVQSCR